MLNFAETWQVICQIFSQNMRSVFLVSILAFPAAPAVPPGLALELPTSHGIQESPTSLSTEGASTRPFSTTAVPRPVVPSCVSTREFQTPGFQEFVWLRHSWKPGIHNLYAVQRLSI